uniref:Notochord homeobox n=1 Tax=Cavia porcellus TaxID=10141 RepID=A0A286XIZ4_CAVPO
MPSPGPRPGGLPACPALPRHASSFSVDAILARPGPRAPATSPSPVPFPVPVPAAPGLWPAPCVGAHAPGSSCCAHPPNRLSELFTHLKAGLQFTHFGWELAHCLGLWAPPEDLQDTERHQKRVRTMFNLEQLEELEKVFAKQHNLVGKKRAQLAARLHLTENQVRIWFQNRRVKYQKQQKLKPPALSAVAPSSSSDSSIQSEDAESGADS